jgi:large subunit ribosomal protein L1
VAHGKRFRKSSDKVMTGRTYPPAEAMNLIKETASAGFDESVELHVRLGVNVKHAEEQLRGTLALPNGLGRDVRVAVFAQGDKARDAEAAGADVIGAEDLAEKIEDGFDEFDVVIATPDMMPTVGRLGRVLGPSGKMPNPKVGTVTEDIEKAVGETKSGKVEYRTDRQAIVHMVIGKASFDPGQLLENYAAVIEEIARAKPSSTKGRYIVSISVATTMGPGIPVDPSLTTEAEILPDGAAPTTNGSGPSEPAVESVSVEETEDTTEVEATETTEEVAEEEVAEEEVAEEEVAEEEVAEEEVAEGEVAEEEVAEGEVAEEEASEEEVAEEEVSEEDAEESSEAEAPEEDSAQADGEE